MGLLALPEGHPGVSLRIDAPERTAGERRRYDLAKLRHLAPRHAPSNRVTLLYARVATSGEKDDLVRQVALLESFAAANGWAYEVIEDVGSKLNHQKRGLRQLIARICSGEVGRLVVTHKDRLLRFGTEVIIINASEDSSFEEDLANDALEIVTVFPARLYGSRSHKNRQVMDELTKAAKQVAPWASSQPRAKTTPMRRTVRFATLPLNEAKRDQIRAVAHAYAQAKDRFPVTLAPASMWCHLANRQRFRDWAKAQGIYPEGVNVHLVDRAAFDAVDTWVRHIESVIAISNLQARIWRRFTNATTPIRCSRTPQLSGRSSRERYPSERTSRSMTLGKNWSVVSSTGT